MNAVIYPDDATFTMKEITMSRRLLLAMFTGNFEAKRYEGKIKGGNALISVHTASSQERDAAKQIFELAHAEDISSTEETSVAA